MVVMMPDGERQPHETTSIDAAGAGRQRLEPGGATPGSTLVNTLLSPSGAMDTLVQRPRALPAVLVLTVLSVGPALVAQQRGVIQARTHAQMSRDPAFQRLSSEQREEMLSRSGRMAPYTVLAGAALSPVAGLLVTSAIFFAAASWLGAQAPFRTMFAVVSHAWLPVAVQGLISVPVLLAKEPAEVEFENLLPLSNLGFLFSRADQPRLYQAASSLDLFSFWVLGLLTLGIARVTRRTWAQALPLVLALWLLYIGIFKILLR
jgi:hypothetical protein